MSYKLDLSNIDRGARTSLTRQLADRVVRAIEAGELAAGDKLPTTRELAADAGVNHLTAARVYRRLAELGYVTASVGRGTFVRSLRPGAEAAHGDEWQTLALPAREPSYQDQILGDAFRLAGEPGMISLSTGHPSPRLYPVEELARIAADVFREEGGDAIAYLTPDGLLDFREQIALRGRRRGFATEAEEVIVTSGAQQGIDLVARTVLEPGDVAAIESPGFAGMLGAFRATGARVIGIPYDDDGLDVDALESVLARHEVKLLGLQTACQNPTGRDLSPERRARLAELVRERNLFVLEDRVYAEVRFEGENRRPLRELAPGHVIHVSAMSKVVGGGLRLGWIAAHGPVRERLAMLKLETDFHTPTLTQHIGARYLAAGGYDRQLEETLPFYRERRDALYDALERHLAGEYRAEPPRGGHHAWVTLARPLDERALYAEAMRHGVTFTPGGAVTAERRTQTALRLSFSLLDPQELDEGVRRLARAMREVRRRDRRSTAMTLS